MFFRRLFFLFFALLILGALFGMNGRSQSQYQAGYVQGFVAGQQSMQAAEGGTAVAPPPAPSYYPGFSFFGFLIKGFAFFFGFMLLVGLLFRLGQCHKGHGPKPLRVRRRWHQWHEEWHQAGHKPPWYDVDADEPVMKA